MKKINLIIFFIILILSILIAIEVIYLFNNFIEKNKEIKNYKIIELEVDEATEVCAGKTVVKVKGKYGIIDIQDGKYIKEPKYDSIIRLDEENFILSQKDKVYIFNFNTQKEIYVESVKVINKKFYKIELDGKYGLLNKEGEIVIDIENDFIQGNETDILVKSNKNWYLYDMDLNKKELKGNYEDIELGIKNHLYVKNNEKLGIINTKEEYKTNFIYTHFMSLSNNILIGYTKDKTYFINLEKGIEKKIDYDNFSSEIDGKIMVLKNGKIGYITDLGEEIIKPIYEGGFLFKKGKDFIHVKKEHKWYLLNLDGILKELSYEDIGEYSEGYMVAELNGRFGYIDEKGNIKIPFDYLIANNFKNELAIIAKESGFGVINKKNKEIIDPIYDAIEIIKDYIYVFKDNKFGIFSTTGKTILPLKYKKLGKINEDLVFFKDEQRTGFIKIDGDKNGN